MNLGTRKSRLAVAQSGWVARQLGPDVRLVGMETEGDRRLDASLQGPLAKGWFTEALESALRDGRIDLAVHSLKDLPVADSPGLVVAAVPARVAPHDVLLVRADAVTDDPALPVRHGGRFGASSTRRQALARVLRPDLVGEPLRGNVPTRLRKVREGEFEAIVLAEAGLWRLGAFGDPAWDDLPGLDLRGLRAFRLPARWWPGAPGQGALAVQCRADDVATRDRLAALHHPATAAAVLGERALLAAMGGGCSVPLGVWFDGDAWTVGVDVGGTFRLRHGRGDGALAALDALRGGAAGEPWPTPFVEEIDVGA